jgi:NADP-dependent aldehyde dehydrogenase
LLPDAVETNEKLPNILAGSVALGVGQFCTNPGLVLGIRSPRLEAFKDAVQAEFSKMESFTMLNEGIYNSYESGKQTAGDQPGVAVECALETKEESWDGRPAFMSVSSGDFIQNPKLHKEVFGPYTLLVECDDDADLLKAVSSLDGQLTGSLFGSEQELSKYAELIISLREKVGRIIFNGMPTGVEVCASMNHGGPFPATTDARYSAVGHDAINRFSRPISYQDCPESLLPEVLKDGNPLNVHRTVDGVLGMH